MKPLLLSGFGTNINVNRRRLIIENRLEKVKYEFFPYHIPYDSLIIDGNYGVITFEAMRWLMSHKISVTLLNWNGNLMSITLPREPISGKLKVKQYETYLDEKRRSDIAQEIIKEKIRHSFNLLKELSRYYKDIEMKKIEPLFLREYGVYERTGKTGYDFYNKKNEKTKNGEAEKTMDVIYMNKNEKKIQKTVDSTMVYEGRIADIYWDCIGSVFNAIYPEFNFKSRNNPNSAKGRNAADEINALLNYGYSVMDSEIRKATNALGIDPSIGFLHELKDSRYSLVCDLQELYRWLVDLSVVQLLEEKRLVKRDFIVTEHYHIRLREKTAKMLIDKIAQNFNEKVPYGYSNLSYQNILYENVRMLTNYILGKERGLRFDIPLIVLSRNDEAKQRERILDMTPKERKELGINKSTLWYQKKYIREGRKIKLYKKTKEILAALS